MERRIKLFRYLPTPEGTEIIAVPEEFLEVAPARVYRGIGEFPFMVETEGVEADREVGLDEWKQILRDQTYTQRQADAIEIVDEDTHQAFIAGIPLEGL